MLPAPCASESLQKLSIRKKNGRFPCETTLFCHNPPYYHTPKNFFQAGDERNIL